MNPLKDFAPPDKSGRHAQNRSRLPSAGRYRSSPGQTPLRSQHRRAGLGLDLGLSSPNFALTQNFNCKFSKCYRTWGLHSLETSKNVTFLHHTDRVIQESFAFTQLFLALSKTCLLGSLTVGSTVML